MSNICGLGKICNRIAGILSLLVGLCLLMACGKVEDTHIIDATVLVSDVSLAAKELTVDTNPNSLLNVPTQVNYYDGYYFIVDCYNNQVIYSEDLHKPLYSWNVLTNDINMGHTIASDGTVYLIDDTENNRVLIFEKSENKFVNTQVLENIGLRPHYATYNEKNDTFYVWSSLTGQMYLIKRDKQSGLVYVSDILEIEELNGIYVRSFTIVDDDILFVSGNANIIEARLKDFKIKKRYPVGNELAGMIQVTPVSDGYLITVSTDANGDQSYATIIKTKSLDNLLSGDYEDVYDNFIGGGTPYYISYIDGKYYLTEHRVPGHSVWSFEYKDNQICNVDAIF